MSTPKHTSLPLVLSEASGSLPPPPPPPPLVRRPRFDPNAPSPTRGLVAASIASALRGMWLIIGTTWALTNRRGLGDPVALMIFVAAVIEVAVIISAFVTRRALVAGAAALAGLLGFAAGLQAILREGTFPAVLVIFGVVYLILPLTAWIVAAAKWRRRETPRSDQAFA